jgi:hypothetical protein
LLPAMVPLLQRHCGRQRRNPVLSVEECKDGEATR